MFSQPLLAFCNDLCLCRQHQIQPFSPRCSFVPPLYLARHKVTHQSVSLRPPNMTLIPDSVPRNVLVSTDEGYELRTTEDKGEGVYATREFQPGETVLVGFILSEVSGNHSHATQVGRNRFVQHGGLNSKLNHSCDPNCGVVLNSEGANDFVAMRRIEKGEELVFDYAMRNYVIEHFPKVCMCGAECCRGRITGYKDLPDVVRRKYRGFIAPYLLEME